MTMIILGLVLLVAAAVAFIAYAIRIETRDHRGAYRHMNSVTRVRDAQRNIT